MEKPRNLSSPITNLVAAILSILSTGLSSTSAHAELQWPTCHFAHHAELSRVDGQAIGRPPSDGTLDSNLYPLRLHYQTGVERDYAEEILDLAEASWKRLFVEMGYLQPHEDGALGGDGRFDLYVVTDLDPGIGGYAGFSGFNPNTPRADAVGYLVINNDLNPRLRRFVVAHEMFHAAQITYDWWEDLAWMEASATWVVKAMFPDDDIFWRFYPFYQQEPWKALDYVSLAGPYSYGMGMFANFLEERFGANDGLLLRDLWELSKQDTMENEPDFLDAISQRVGDPGTLARQFGTWRVLIGSRHDGTGFHDGGYWENVDPVFEVEASPGMNRVDGTLVNPVGPLGHGFLRFPRLAGEVADYHVTLTGIEGSQFAVDLVVLESAGRRLVDVGVVDGLQSQSVVVESASGIEEIIVIVTHMGVDYDADTSPWTGASLAYSFEARF